MLTYSYFHCIVEYFKKIIFLGHAVCLNISGLPFPRNLINEILKNKMNGHRHNDF